MFSEEIKNYSWKETTQEIHQKTDADAYFCHKNTARL